MRCEYAAQPFEGRNGTPRPGVLQLSVIAHEQRPRSADLSQLCQKFVLAGETYVEKLIHCFKTRAALKNVVEVRYRKSRFSEAG